MRTIKERVMSQNKKKFQAMLAHSILELPDEVVDGWLNSPDLLRQRAQTLAASFKLPLPIEVDFTTFKKSIAAVPKELNSDYTRAAKVALARVKNWGATHKGKVVLLQLSKLGFAGDTSYQDMVQQAEKFGLQQCRYATVLLYTPEWKRNQVVHYAIKPIMVERDKSQIITACATETGDGGGWGSVWPYWQRDVADVTKKFSKDSWWVLEKK